MKLKLFIFPFLFFLIFSCDFANLNHINENKNTYQVTNDFESNGRAPQEVVTLYAKAKYKGKYVKLPVGNYRSVDLINSGFKNNDAESIKVKSGYLAKLYDGEVFTGYSVTINKNKKRLSKKIKNKVSSVSIYKIGTDDDDDDDNNNDNNDNDNNDDNNDCKRIGISNDGNLYDTEAVGSSAFSIAIIAAYKQNLVHYDYSNNLCKTGLDAEMRISVTEAARKFLNDTSMVFSCQTELESAIANGAHQINISSATDRFYYSCAGPMEVPWRIVHAALPEKRQYCSVFSYSGWNNHHTSRGCEPEGINMKRKWSDLQKSGVVSVGVSSTSSGKGQFRAKPGDWDPLQNINHAGVNWLPSRLFNENNHSVTDATLAWFLCTGAKDAVCSDGDDRGNVEKALALFEAVWGLK